MWFSDQDACEFKELFLAIGKVLGWHRCEMRNADKLEEIQRAPLLLW
jgi:hypothetical protein